MNVLSNALLEQGKLTIRDKVLYLGSTVQLNSSGLIIGIGSPSTEFYSVIPDGIIEYRINNQPIFRKLYLRQTTTGSLY